MGNYLVARQFIARNNKLRELGFSNYREYLGSDIWKQIKSLQAKKIKSGKTHWKVCWVCGTDKNINLHHIKYTKIDRVRLGTHIFPLCERHHLDTHNLANRNKKMSLKSALKKTKKRYLKSTGKFKG